MILPGSVRVRATTPRCAQAATARRSGDRVEQRSISSTSQSYQGGHQSQAGVLDHQAWHQGQRHAGLGQSMGDDFIWNMAAFLQELPKLDKSGYEVLVAGSGGHSHGGGEAGDPQQADDSKGHHDSGDHDHGDSVDHGMPTSPVPLSSAKSSSSIPAPAPVGRATAPTAAPESRNPHEGMDMSKSPATEPSRSDDDGHDNQR